MGRYEERSKGSNSTGEHQENSDAESCNNEGNLNGKDGKMDQDDGKGAGSDGKGAGSAGKGPGGDGKGALTIHLRVAALCLATFLLYAGYYLITSVMTSLNGNIGFIASACLWLTFVPSSLFVSPMVVKVLEWKISILVAFVTYLTFFSANFYPSWYTLVPAAAATGFNASFFWIGALSFLTIASRRMKDIKGVSFEHTLSHYQGVFFFSFYLSAVVGSLVSTLFLLSDQLLTDRPHSNTSNTSCDIETSPSEVSTWAYYGFVATATCTTIGATIIVAIIPPMPGETSVCITAKAVSCASVFQETKLSVKTFLRMIIKPKVFLSLPMNIYAGLLQGFFLGIFSKYYVAECLGIGYVGMATMVWGLGTAVSSYGTSHLSIYVTRSVLVGMVTAGVTSLFLFLLLWLRVPSFPVVFTAAIVLGLSQGTFKALPTIYLGVVGKENKEVVYGLGKAAYGSGGAFFFFLAAYIPLQGSLAILLCVALLYLLYLSAELVYGRTGRRPPDCQYGVYEMN